MGVKKQRVGKEGKMSFSRGGGDIIFGPKYRPLPKRIPVLFCIVTYISNDKYSYLNGNFVPAVFEALRILIVGQVHRTDC
jgi:hypothetical protein